MLTVQIIKHRGYGMTYITCLILKRHGSRKGHRRPQVCTIQYWYNYFRVGLWLHAYWHVWSSVIICKICACCWKGYAGNDVSRETIQSHFELLFMTIDTDVTHTFCVDPDPLESAPVTTPGLPLSKFSYRSVTGPHKILIVLIIIDSFKCLIA